MVTEEEIRHISELMRIEIDDYREYINKIHAIVDYFDILDSAGVDDEVVSMPEISISDLRKDRHVPFDERLIEKLNRYRGSYVRAPKMS